jgi:chromosome segregation ATPase
VALIEALMFYALGVLSAGILALIVAPPLWRRAVRLTRRHIEQTMPMTRAEIQAEKDQIRAAFAVSARRLDSTIERLESQVTEQLIDINRKREIISHLTAEGSMSAEDMIALEKQRDDLLIQATAQQREIGEAALLRGRLEARIVEVEASLGEAKAAFDKLVSERETQRLEIVARDTELDNLRDSVAAVKTTSTVEEVARAGIDTEMSELRTSLAIERRKLAEADALVVATEAKHLAAFAEISARDEEIAKVRGETQAAKARIEELSFRLVEAETAGMNLIAIEESKAELEARLSHLETVNRRLEAELAQAKTEAAKANEDETTLLRAKLIDIGAAVARLSARTEGPTLVPAIAEEPAKPKLDDEPAQGESTPAAISLAERIRALQHASGGF